MPTRAHNNGHDDTTSANKRRKANTQAEEDAKLSFEEELAQLDEIVASLEDGGLPLDDALALFERGVGLARRCQEQLDNASLRVERLRAVGGFTAPAEAGESSEAMGASFALEVFDADDDMPW